MRRTTCGPLRTCSCGTSRRFCSRVSSGAACCSAAAQSRGDGSDRVHVAVTSSRAQRRSPTTALLLGLIITLATVVVYSWYISGQISGLRRLQTELTDRNRRDSLQLLRIQNDLNQLALAMRDMLDAAEPYPLTAWSTQFERIRLDLDDALKQQG